MLKQGWQRLLILAPTADLSSMEKKWSLTKA